MAITRVGIEAAHKWNKTIHGRGDRFDWIEACIAAMVAGRPTPPPPGRWHKGTPERRLETLGRILQREAA